jgi:hypothetical protein
LGAGSVDPSQVREFRIAGAGNNSSVESLEALKSLRESNDLSRADEAIMQPWVKGKMG